MAGGTGGHVFPALAVADELRRAGQPVLWLGTHEGLEAKVVPAAGLPIAWIKVRGLRGKGVLRSCDRAVHVGGRALAGRQRAAARAAARGARHGRLRHRTGRLHGLAAAASAADP
jgi:UDP-N-acetylglucosamine:LPS N-acetylglucosamine transferase